MKTITFKEFHKQIMGLYPDTFTNVSISQNSSSKVPEFYVYIGGGAGVTFSATTPELVIEQVKMYSMGLAPDMSVQYTPETEFKQQISGD